MKSSWLLVDAQFMIMSEAGDVPLSTVVVDTSTNTRSSTRKPNLVLSVCSKISWAEPKERSDTGTTALLVELFLSLASFLFIVEMFVSLAMIFLIIEPWCLLIWTSFLSRFRFVLFCRWVWTAASFSFRGILMTSNTSVFSFSSPGCVMIVLPTHPVNKNVNFL